MEEKIRFRNLSGFLKTMVVLNILVIVYKILVVVTVLQMIE